MSDRNPYPPSPRRDEEPPDDILYTALEVSAGEARDDELGLEFHVTAAGALYARPIRPGERTETVISSEALTLSVLRGIDEVGSGDVVVPIAGDGENAVVRQTLAHGTGAITLTDQRLLGMVWRSGVDAASLRADLDEEGEGRVIAFSVRREALDDIEVAKNVGRLRSATLTGAASCAVALEAPLRILEGEDYAEGPKGAIERRLRSFVGADPSGDTTRIGVAAPAAGAAAAARPEPTEPLPRLGALADPPPPSEDPPDAGVPKWLLPAGAAAVIAGLAIALGFLLFAGGDDDSTASADANARGPSAEFVTAVTAPVRRLNRSAEITGRRLARTANSAHINRVSRTATQQLAVVQEQRARIADLQVGPGERVARGTLARAIQAHRTYLTTLSRMGALDAAEARAQFPRLRSQSQRLLTQYRAFFAQAPTLPQGVTSAGLADLAGVNEAINDRRRLEEVAAAEAEAEQQSGGGGSSTSGGSSSGGPILSDVYGADIGSLIEIGAQYCDRTPGAVNDFIYTFEIRRGGATVAQDSYSASQTRACNSISMTFSDGFPLGSYEAAVIVDNLTNNVRGSAVTSFSVVN